MQSLYTTDQILSLPFWLENMRTSFVPAPTPEVIVDKQRLAFNIVNHHFGTNVNQPLFMMMTGQGGSGKSFVIDSLRSLLATACIVTSYFGIAAFNVEGVTLHSLLRLLTPGKNNCDLKGQALVKLQMRMLNGYNVWGGFCESFVAFKTWGKYHI